MRVMLMAAAAVLVGLSVHAQEVQAVKAARVHLGNGHVLEPGVILVAEGRIRAVSQGESLPEGVELRDLGSFEVTPGLVDAYTHAGLPRGPNENEEGSEMTPAFRAATALDPADEELERLLAAGITTLGVHPGIRNVLAGLACAVKTAGAGRGPHVLAGDLALEINLGSDPRLGNRSPGFGWAGWRTRLPTSRMDVVFLVRDAFQDALAWRKARRKDPGLQPVPQHTILLRVLDGELPVHWLARRQADIETALRLAREFSIPHNVVVDCWEAHRVAELLSRDGVDVLHGPFIHPRNHWGGRREEALHFSPAAPRLLRQAGVQTALAHGGVERGETLMDGLRFAVRAGFPAGEALSLVTAEPARILGVADRVGLLAEGRDADLVAFDGDPLAPTSAVRWVMVEGRVVLEHPAEHPAPEPESGTEVEK